MNKRQLLEAMRTERRHWEEVLAQIPSDRFVEPTMHGGWSVKDTIGHVAYYERWLLAWLEDAVRGKVTAATHRDLLDVNERNALIYAENLNRPLSDILAEAQRVHDQLYQLVKTLPEEDLIDPYRFERYIVPFWERSLPLWECIAGDSYRHYAEHTANLCVWLEKTRGRGSSGRELQELAFNAHECLSIKERPHAMVRLHAFECMLAAFPEKPVHLNASEVTSSPCKCLTQ